MRDRMPDIDWRLVALGAAAGLLAIGIAALAFGLGADEEARTAQRAPVADLREIAPAEAARESMARSRPRPALPPAPAPVAALARRLTIERKVAQLFLLGFAGQDTADPIFERLRELDVGGVALDEVNYSHADQLATLAHSVTAVAADAGHVPPWVLAAQEGGEFNAFPDLPPQTSAADASSGAQAFEESEAAAKALGPLGINGVLAPVADVAPPDGAALGQRAYSDAPREVATYAAAVVDAYRGAGFLTAAAHFPGLGSGAQDTRLAPSQVTAGLDALRRRDLVPFRAAIRANVPAVILSNALYVTDDFVTPATLSRAIATTLLRHELRFGGLAITDDLADPAVTALTPIPDAAVAALQAGADLLHISGPPDAQQAAYDAVLAAVRDGRIPRFRLNEALLRNLTTKYDYGLVG